MFTFGIFTTHLPYAALVLFYFFVIITGFTRKPTPELRTIDMHQTGVVVCCAPQGFVQSTFSPAPDGQPAYAHNETSCQHLLPEKWLTFPLTDEIFIDRPARHHYFSRPPPAV